MNKKESPKAIAYRVWNPVTHLIYYVSEVKGDGGVDWGYSPKASQALPLSKYWQKRFAADCRYCGDTAHFIDV